MKEDIYIVVREVIDNNNGQEEIVESTDLFITDVYATAVRFAMKQIMDVNLKPEEQIVILGAESNDGEIDYEDAQLLWVGGV